MRYDIRYVHKIAPKDSDVCLDVEISDGAFAGRNELGKELRSKGLMARGSRVQAFRSEADRIVVFPILPGSTTYWHSIIITTRI